MAGGTTTRRLWLTVRKSCARDFEDVQQGADNPSAVLNQRESHTEWDVPTSPNAIIPKPSQMNWLWCYKQHFPVDL